MSEEALAQPPSSDAGSSKTTTDFCELCYQPTEQYRGMRVHHDWQISRTLMIDASGKDGIAQMGLLWSATQDRECRDRSTRWQIQRVLMQHAALQGKVFCDDCPLRCEIVHQTPGPWTKIVIYRRCDFCQATVNTYLRG